MLTIEIKLRSAITGKTTTLATGKIVNTGTGTPTRGNYIVVLRDAAGREWRRGTVEDFPRKRLLAWDLLYRALESLVGSRNVTLKTVPVCDLIMGTHNTFCDKGTDDDRAATEPGPNPEAP